MHSRNDLTCAFSPDVTRDITGVHGHNLRLWDANTGECLQAFTGHSGFVRALVMHGDRVLTASATTPCVCGILHSHVWDVASGKCLRVIEAHRTHVQSLAFSADQRRVLSGSLHARIWNLESGRCLHTFEGHTDTIRSAAWNEDERLVLTASHDGTVRVWDGPRSAFQTLRISQRRPWMSTAWESTGASHGIRGRSVRSSRDRPAAGRNARLTCGRWHRDW